MPNHLQTFNCYKEFILVLSLKEKKVGQTSCPSCISDKIEPQTTTFYTKTSKNS
jgi:hypothetical protein